MIEGIVEMIKSLVTFETLLEWAGNKLVEDYGVTGMEVKRVKDAVVIVVKANEDKLDKIEEDARRAVSNMGFTRKIDVEVIENGNGC